MRDTKKSENIWKKIILILIGSVISAYGIDLAIYAGFGGAALAVLRLLRRLEKK